jgi:hypothetical protein
MTRPKPPEAHTQKLRRLVADSILARARVYDDADPLLIHTLQHAWEPHLPLPRGATTTYLRMEGQAAVCVDSKFALSSLARALRGKRPCPPGADYAPAGWREFIESEAAKAAKE